PANFGFGVVRRIFDLVFALIASVVCIPVIVIFGLLIFLQDGGPVFYLQERVGLQGKHFMIYRLRSMRLDAEANGAQMAEEDDPRITKIGRFIRKTRIDELPQVINVFKGDMSIIGPRPERPIFVVQFNEEIPGFIERLRVKPGITGWAQVNGGYDISTKEKLDLDMYYINHQSIFLDMKILFKTIKIIFTGEGAR
ncbi:MAG: sugar transferase, partial [Clostridiales bacterium]|nr:sugar transferase [Clostridiales bacterium]